MGNRFMLLFSRRRLTTRTQKTEASKEEGDNIVLVSVDWIKNLKRAYPNYFLDTTQFSSLLTEAISYRAKVADKPRST